MFVHNGLVGVFNATELIYAVFKANKGGLDSLNLFQVYYRDIYFPICALFKYRFAVFVLILCFLSVQTRNPPLREK